MIPWEMLDSTTVDGEGGELRLFRRGEEFSIRSGKYELMNSRMHGSEDALAELVSQRLNHSKGVRILIGGLGMGFTLAAALNFFGDDVEIVVAELVPAVVAWNQGVLSSLAGNPLQDKRVSVYQGDVGQAIGAEKGAFDAILLDVDNGPDGLTRKENDSLYSMAGLKASLVALKLKGIFAVWSICPDERFSKRLKSAGFQVEEAHPQARGRRGGGRHMIWLAKK